MNFGDAGSESMMDLMERVVKPGADAPKPASERGAPGMSAASERAPTKKAAARDFKLKTDASRDALLTDFGKETLNDRYLLPGESYQDLFARVAAAYADDEAHAQRIYDYISQLCSCPRRRCCRTAAPVAACRSAAI